VLDIRSIIVSGILTNAICVFVVVVLWRQNRARFNGLPFWVGNYALQTTGLLLIALRGVVPDWISIVPSNLFVVFGALLGLWGLERFTGRKSFYAYNTALVAAFFLLHLALTFIHPCLWARSANIALALLLICLQCAWLLLKRVDLSLRPATRLVGLVFASYSLLFAIRIVFLLTRQNSTNEYFQTGSIEALFMVVIQVHFILLTYALNLMVNQRLVQTIQLQEEKYAKAFHSAPYAVILTRSFDGKILEVNNTFVGDIGYSRDELVGNSTLTLDLWASLADRVSVIETLTAHGKVAEAEVQFKKKNGELIDVLFSAEAIVINGESYLLSTIRNVTDRKQAELERERLISEREKALSEAKVLRGLLPICASCKKIRDEMGQWHPVETYVHFHSEAEFSHGLCPACEQALYPGANEAAAQRG